MGKEKNNNEIIYFFSIPSKLSHRRSQNDPLGFRMVADHFLERIVPGFSEGGILNWGWYPILAWGAMILEQDKTHNGIDQINNARAYKQCRERLAYMERALRLGAILRKSPKDEWG